jgi:hypothetical protein
MPSAGSGSDSGQMPSPVGMDGGPVFDAGVCVRGGLCARLERDRPNAVDLLFVIDNSQSMATSQALLRAQFPRLLNQLTSGGGLDSHRSPLNDQFPAVESLHLGVVSTDMGVSAQANYAGCDMQGGDDALLQHEAGSAVTGCQASYPAFLEYNVSTTAQDEVATDLACIADLGVGGCGFEQPLEAGLKALWPRVYVDATGKAYDPSDNPIYFLETPAGSTGHGDTPAAQGGNGGFLRTDGETGAILALVVVTDEDDCSVRDPSFLSTEAASPSAAVNTLCQDNQNRLFAVDRYIQGYRALHPGRESTVLFGALAGVPPDLVDDLAREPVNFSDEASTDAFYDGILDDERMQYRIIAADESGPERPSPSCTREDMGGPRNAFPPRRIVEVAKGFGSSGFVRSICEEDFAPAIDLLVHGLANQLSEPCLGRELERGHDGLVKCNVVWQLPKPGAAPQQTPVTCDEREFLQPVSGKYPEKNSGGGVNCAVRQLPVVTLSAPPEGRGFYYDDITLAGLSCKRGHAGRISFTDEAKLPQGVEAFLDCSPDAEPR